MAPSTATFLIMPIFTTCGSTSLTMASICAPTTCAGKSNICCMPSVFCMVMEVMADTARPPKAVIVLMSACTPDSPVPSEPVMVSMG